MAEARAAKGLSCAPAVRVDVPPASPREAWLTGNGHPEDAVTVLDRPSEASRDGEAALLARDAVCAASAKRQAPSPPRGMINPNSSHKLAWDWLVVCLVVFTTLSMPLDLALFDTDCNAPNAQAPAPWQYASLTQLCRAEAVLDDAVALPAADAAVHASYRYTLRTACKPKALDVLDTLVDVVFWLDIVLVFSTGIFREREDVVDYDRARVACTYASRGFIPDVLSAIPFDAIGRAFGGGGNQTHMIILKLFRLPRLLRLSRLLRKLEHMSSATLFRVAVLVSAYVLIGHWAACGFFYISKWQLAHSESGWVENSAGLRPWIVTQCLQFERAPVRYVASLYFALTTMATVGFGDVTPGSNMERCFAMALQLVAGVLQGVVFGNIGVALAGFDRSSAAVKAVKRDACALARAAGLPNSLARRLAVAASAQALATQQLDTTDALSELTGTIRCDAEAATAGACALAATPLVRCAMPPLPRGFSAAVARRLRVMALPSGEFATTAGDADGDTFLLLHGSVRITPPQGGFDARIGAATTVHAPALVAISDAVLCQRASAHVRARGHATLLVISRACLDDALEEFPEALAPLTAHALINDAWHRTDAGSSTPMVAAVAAAAASQIFVERQSTRKGGFGGGSASGSNVLLPGSVGAAILEAPVPMLTALRTGGAGVGQAALSASGGDAAPNTPAAAARWSKAGTAARMVVRLAGVVHGNELQRAAETREHVATPRVAADPLAGADWTAFNARLHAFVSAQADAFAALEMRLSAINPALSSTVDPASAF